MPRYRFFPPDDVTAAEWLYLVERFGEHDADDRRARIVLALKRLVHKGIPAEDVHRALMGGVDRWQQHQRQQMTRQQAQRRNAAIDRARKDLDRALASLRRLLPDDNGADGGRVSVADDDVLFQLREFLLTPITVTSSARPRGGRPWEWKQDTDEALRDLKVTATDRHELLAALAFVTDDATG